MKIFQSLPLVALMALQFSGNAQGLIQNTQPQMLGCGSHELSKNLDQKMPGVLEGMNAQMRLIQQIVRNQAQRSSDDLYIVPVVFHVVYNNASENLPDSVLENQLSILNEAFRRQNADTVNLRSDFEDLVGDAHIEFRFATEDPDGNPTNGITRTQTNIEHFGGILPYSPGQTPQILQWVEDSLYYNLFRLMQDSLGGKDEWNREKYFNVWIGDLRIFEPQFGNFEEVVFFGLATPPPGFAIWPDSIYGDYIPQGEGVIMHYVNVGSNNPESFDPPYNTYNGVTTTGKILVHEAGHYLGLRHIWGDGDCTQDDYVDDTPNANAHSQFGCNVMNNNCTDTINGVDLPNMVENYMDYSSGNCQNSFTKGQVEVMRYVLENFKSDIYILNVAEKLKNYELRVFPNPTTGEINLEWSEEFLNAQVRVYNANGSEVYRSEGWNNGIMRINIPGPSGVYFLQIVTKDSTVVQKIVKQ
jgi:hypothetical protein